MYRHIENSKLHAVILCGLQSKVLILSGIHSIR